MLFAIPTCLQRDSKATAGCHCQLQYIAFLHLLMGDFVCFRIVLVVRILCICIDSTVIYVILIEEIEFQNTLVSVLIALSSDVPIVLILVLTGNGDVVSRLCFQVNTPAPVARNVFYELESIVVFLVVFGQVGYHL